VNIVVTIEYILACRVLNNDTEFERAYATGVDGIMTDYPTQLDEFLV
jgi:glycerophosphoryl diester phosphodiesterase